MEFLELIKPVYAASGFGVGLIVGLTGVGGGSLMTPILVLLFGINPAVAVGTDLLFAAVTKTAGTAMHGFNGTVNWGVVMRLAAGSVPTALLTIALLSASKSNISQVAKLISITLGCALLLTSLSLFFHKAVHAFALAADTNNLRARGFLTVLTGAILGLFVTVSSVGAGALGVTALLLLYPRLRIAGIVGTDIAHAVPLTLVAGLGHAYAGFVDWEMLAALLLGSIPGIIIGSQLAPRAPELTLRILLACVLAAVGFKLVVS